jgi:hypothetical protein
MYPTRFIRLLAYLCLFFVPEIPYNREDDDCQMEKVLPANRQKRLHLPGRQHGYRHNNR